MDLLVWFFYALVGVHLSLSCWQLKRMSSSLKWVRQQQRFVSKDTPMNRIFILIPVYQEAAVIKASVKYFAQLAQFPNILICYISTEKEGSRSDTVVALEQMRQQYEFLHHLHYPETEGFKAHQLNWAIKHILASHSDVNPWTMYFGIYDVDSRPEIDVIKTILFGREPIYQQPSIYLENYTRLGPMQQVGALFQTKWELCENIPIFRAYQRSLKKGSPLLSLPHLTGHGLFIRADILAKTNLLDTGTLTEDLEFGYRAAFRDIPITLLHEIDYTQYAPTYPAAIRQTSRWFHGEMNLYRYYVGEKRRSNSKKLGGWLFKWLVFKRYGTTLKWALGAPLVSFVLLALIFRNPINIVLVPLAVFLYAYLPFKSILRCARWRTYMGKEQNLLALTLSGCVVPLLNTCGPFHFFVTSIINRLRGRSATFVRTPKN